MILHLKENAFRWSCVLFSMSLVANFAHANPSAVLGEPLPLSAHETELERLEEGAVREFDRTIGGCDHACRRTTEAALRACRNAAEDDYWIAVGKCLNLPDDDECEDCLDEARAARTEAKTLCREQYRGRQEVCEDLGDGPYNVEVDPEDFLTVEEATADPHPYFPMAAGMRWVYEKENEVIEVTVLPEVKEILGVECFVLRDVVHEGDTLVEDTFDWFAVDKEGNVWYFGEIVKNYEDGELVSLDGSWKAGVEGAQPGIVMLAEPKVETLYRQEFFLGEAEDLAEVIDDSATESVPAASCDGDCVVTEEFTPIEPGHVAHKYYAPGVGLILGINQENGEREELVEFDAPARAALGVSSVAGPAIPKAVRTHPNPFSGSTTVSFQLDRASDVEVDVFDAAGRRVRTLSSGALGAGSHTLTWDGADDAAQRSAVGVYFVRVKSDGESRTRKVVLTK